MINIIKLLLGGSPCFTKGHLVLTKEGYKDISEIEVGDEVLTHKKRFKKVVKVGSKEDYIWNLKIMGYPTFKTTNNHPFYTIKRISTTKPQKEQEHIYRTFTENAEWIEVKDLTSNHFCGQHIINSETETSIKIDEEFAWILGRYVADGHYRKEKRKGRLNSYQYQLILSIGDKKLEEFKEQVQTRHYSCFKHSQSTYRCVFSSKEMVNFLIDNGFNKGAYNKNIPEFIFNLPKNLKERFLNGYLSGDGYYNSKDDSYSATTISPLLAFSLQRLITGLYNTNCSVSLYPNNRQSTINGRIIKGNHDIYNISFKKGLRKQSVAHLQNDIIWTQVKEVVETNQKDIVYNIEVEEDHSYTINNCIVHNCTNWSIAQRSNREIYCEGKGWELFQNYVITKELFQPDYYLYENNCSASTAIKDEILKQLGGTKYDFNSSLISAQHRARFYVTNIPDIILPPPSNVIVKDILDTVKVSEVIYHLADKDRRKIIKPTKNGIIRVGELNGKDSQGYRVYSINGKAVTICAGAGGVGAKTGLYEMENGDVRKLTVSEARRLQTIPDWVQIPVSDNQAYKQLGNGWTIEVIKHLLKTIPNLISEELCVVSLYDGMGCGYIALKELGCNIKQYISVEIDKYCNQTLDANIPQRIAFMDCFDIRDENSALYKQIQEIS